MYNSHMFCFRYDIKDIPEKEKLPTKVNAVTTVPSCLTPGTSSWWQQQKDRASLLSLSDRGDLASRPNYKGYLHLKNSWSGCRSSLGQCLTWCCSGWLFTHHQAVNSSCTAEQLKTLPSFHQQEARFHQPCYHSGQEVKRILLQEVQSSTSLTYNFPTPLISQPCQAPVKTPKYTNSSPLMGPYQEMTSPLGHSPSNLSPGKTSGPIFSQEAIIIPGLPLTMTNITACKLQRPIGLWMNLKLRN